MIYINKIQFINYEYNFIIKIYIYIIVNIYKCNYIDR